MKRTIKQILEDKKKSELEAKRNKPKSTSKVIRVDEKLQLKKSY